MKPLNKRTYQELCTTLSELKKERKPFLVAIDGRCASGKTTLARHLQEDLQAIVVHMDDFFLRPEQRTPERYATPGGNVDWERMEEELLAPLASGKDTQFRALDCGNLQLGKTQTQTAGDFIIVEGSYSLHPQLQKYYHYRIFLTVPYEVQLSRIEVRNGLEKKQMFIDKWIPYEELYFSTYKIQDICDEVYETNSINL